MCRLLQILSRRIVWGLRVGKCPKPLSPGSAYRFTWFSKSAVTLNFQLSWFDANGNSCDANITSIICETADYRYDAVMVSTAMRLRSLKRRKAHHVRSNKSINDKQDWSAVERRAARVNVVSSSQLACADQKCQHRWKQLVTCSCTII